ncbi:hypothetical protein QBC40DRAFT_17657 [Triangularia verruculosa]|uniref:Uncharacterized protein n=1 Tax=Triangularia verruculosa TaxID=2587418 RepID=A0AAN6XNA2_9PEZI|nr:hypothetical protein QBC40DRAFT_17657 [Triangularia verruculosa]
MAPTSFENPPPVEGDAKIPGCLDEWTGFMLTLFAIPCILMIIAVVCVAWRQKQGRTTPLVISMDDEATEVANVRTPLLAVTPPTQGKNMLTIPETYTPYSISPALSGRTEIASPVEEGQQHKLKDIPEFSISKAT